MEKSKQLSLTRMEWGIWRNMIEKRKKKKDEEDTSNKDIVSQNKKKTGGRAFLVA